jgi:quinol monooxygenase YgiN
MIVEYIRYKIAKERVEPFLGAYGEAEKSLRASAHCLGFELSRCTEAPEHFILRIEWDSDEGHLQGFRQSAQFPPFLAAVKPFLAEIEEMRHYDLTPLRWSR